MPSWRTDPSNIRLMQFLLGCGQRISAVLQKSGTLKAKTHVKYL